MAENLYDLSATIGADTSRFDTSVKSTQAAIQQTRDRLKELAKEANTPFKSAQMGALRDRLKELAARYKDLNKAQKESGASMRDDFGGALQTVAPRLAAFAGSGGPITLAAGALVATAAAIGGAVSGIYKLVSASAEATGRIFDLSQKTNFSAETLSALQHAAETSGGSIETVSAALGIFQKNMESAASGNEEMARTFKILNIDVNDNEKALRQAFAILSRIPAGAQQTALSMKLFGRSGREVQAIYKEAGGDLDKFISTLRDKGLLVTTQAAQKGDELSDSITKIGQQFSATGRQVANEFAPMVADALAMFSRWLRDNQGELVATARAVAGLLKDIGSLASFIYSISPLRLTVQVIRTFTDVMGAPAAKDSWTNPPASQTSYFGKLWDIIQRGPDPNPRDVRGKFGYDIPGKHATPADIAATAKANVDAQKKAADDARKLQNQLNGLRLPRGGGGGGGGKKEIDEVARALKRQSVEIDDAILKTDRYDQEINRLVESLKQKGKTLDDTKLAQLRANAETLRAIHAEDDYREFMQGLSEDLYDATHRTDEWDRALRQIEKQLAKNKATLKDFIGAEHEDIIAKLRLIDLLKKEAVAMQELNIVRQRYADILRNTRPRRATVPENPDVDIVDLGGGSVYARDRRGTAETPEDILNKTRPRRANQEEYDRHKQRIEDMARDITSALDNAIYEGFRGGVKRGLASMLESMLQMINNIMLKQIEQGLTDLLSKVNVNGGAGGGKSGIFGAIFGAIFSGIGGLFGGGGGSWGKMGQNLPSMPRVPLARGMDFVPFDNFPALLHRGERVVPAEQNGMGGNVVVNMTVVTPNAQSFGGRDTQAQISRQMQTVMKQAAVRVS